METKLVTASYDVCFQPLTNVTAEVNDPHHPSEEEINMILEKAADNILQNYDDKINPENSAYIELYSVDKGKKNGCHILRVPETVLNCMPSYIPTGLKDDTITKYNLKRHGWEYGRTMKTYRNKLAGVILRLYDENSLTEETDWYVKVYNSDDTNIGGLHVKRYSEIEAFVNLIQSMHN